MDRAMQIITNRVDQFGVAEPVVQRQGKDRIIVELPGLKDIDRAMKLIGQTAQLEFKLLKPKDERDLVLKKMDEVLAVMHDLRQVEVDILTIGQYLQPTREHLPIARYYTPEEFDMFRERGYAMGFRWVESGPLVRSSYNAEAQVRTLLNQSAGA